MNKEQKQNQQELSVVLGATGAIGTAVVKKLVEKKQNVRIVSRNLDSAEKLFKGMNVEYHQADMLSKEDTKRAIAGGTVVYNCIGIPYTKWLKQFPIIHENIIEAIAETKAIMVYADNLYMYGKMNGEKISEDHPENATSKKGQLRKLLAQELLEKHKQGKIKAVIVRFGDFYGPNVVNGFTLQLFPNALAGKAANWIGSLDKKHSLIYINDAAEGLIEVANNPEMYGKVWHIEGAEPVTGQEFIEMIFDTLNTEPKIKTLKRGTINFLSPFVPILGEIRELLDQWEYPFVIDGKKYQEKTGNKKCTSHHEAIKTTVEWFKINYKI